MAKLRQEINLTCAALSASGTAIAQLDTTQYSGSLTYAFETVASVASGTCTVTLRRSGTTTDDATISVTATSPTRQRVTFTPPSGQTQYFVNLSGGTTPSVLAARIVALIDTSSSSLTACETQIEIGNQETGRSNTTEAALANPKYWKYEAASWDTHLTCYAEAVWTCTGSGGANVTVALQQDGGADNFVFADLVTIVANGSGTTAARTRVAFTPTDGRNYRLATTTSSSMGSASIYAAKIIVDQDVGNEAGGATANNSTATLVGGTTTSNAEMAESFTLSTAATITGVKLMLGITGAPADSLVADLVTSLTGTALATGSIAASSLTTTMTLTTITFAASYTVTAGTTYYIRLSRSPNTQDLTNAYHVGISTATAGYPFGNLWQWNGSGWVSETADLQSFTLTGSGFATPTTAITKLQPEYLLVNAPQTSGTGLKNVLTSFDPAEWSGVTNVYLAEHNADTSTSATKVQQGIGGTPTDVTNSAITGTNRQRSSALSGMPTSADTLDTNITAF